MSHAAVKKIFIKNLTEGYEGEAAFLVLSHSQGRTNRGGVYLNLELGDATGRISAKVWEEALTLAGKLVEGTVALVRGYVDSYRGAFQFIVREACPLAPEQINWADYLRASPRAASEMKAELWLLIDSLSDPDFRRLAVAALKDPEVGKKFYLTPAAKSLHHAYLHGLLEHSLSVGRLAAKVAEHYGKELNRDLLVAGAILHDLGKIWEFTPLPRVDYSTQGRLKGHLVMGAGFLESLAKNWSDFPAEKLELMEHLILSHHGEPAFGAPVRPHLLEAVVLHHLDNIDAKLAAIVTFLDDGVDAEGWSAYHRLFGGYFRRTINFSSSFDGARSGDDSEEAESSTQLEERLLF